MDLIVNARKWEGTAEELNTSTRVFELGDQFYVKGDKTRCKFADGVTPLGELPWSDTAVKNHEASAIDATATASAAELATGLITSTSAAAVALTLPDADDLAAALGAEAGSWFDFAVDNSAGDNTVTVTASASITAATAVVTGGATLTVASGAVGLFRIYFVSGTAAKIYRVG